jgi:voltage-gated potassium channel
VEPRCAAAFFLLYLRSTRPNLHTLSPMSAAPIPGLRNLRMIFTLLAVLALVGTIGFHVIEGWPWFDSFYTVLITVTTIGTNDLRMSEAGRAFSVFVIVVGVGLVFLAIGALASALLEFELLKFFGRRRMEREITRLKDHFIICGAGRVGRSVARELLRNKVPWVIVDNSQEKMQKLDPTWLVVNGDATTENALRQVNIDQARGLVAAATTDAINLYIVLTARTLNPKLKIIARASEEDAEKHLRTAGADIVLSPYSFVGHRIAQSFLRPNVIDFIDVATARNRRFDWEIEEIQITSQSRFAGQTIAGSRIRQDMNVIVLAIKRASGMRFNPAPEDKIEPGDYLIAMGEPAGLKRLEESAAK